MAKETIKRLFCFRGEEALQEFSDIKTVTLKLPQFQNLSFTSNAAKQYSAPVMPPPNTDDVHLQKMLNHTK